MKFSLSRLSAGGATVAHLVVVLVAALQICAGAVVPTTTTTTTTTTTGGWHPTRIALQDLHDAVPGTVDRLVAALQDVGLVSLSGVNLPHWQGPLQECLMTMMVSSSSSSTSSPTNIRNHVQSVALADGTIRTTLAVEGTQDLSDIFSTSTSTTTTTTSKHPSSSSSSCQALEESGTALRHRVDTVLSDILARLTEALGLQGVELLTTSENTNQPHGILDLPGILKDALVLEHFHHYDAAAPAPNHHGRPSSPNNNNNDEDADWALDWHVDQGLFLAFVPGSNAQGQSNKEGEFHIQFQDGSTQRVEFDLHHDELVLMVGDAAEQIINPALRALSSKSSSSSHPKPLRALPHALTLRSSRSSSETTTTAATGPRLWYGRMVLPPLSAHHPLAVSSSSQSNNSDEPHGSPTTTYGDVRHALMMSSFSSHEKDTTTAPVLGCSSPHQRVVVNAGSSFTGRFLAEEDGAVVNATSCNPDRQAFCWHQCMNYTDDNNKNESPESCAERELTLACGNEEGYLWTDDIHDAQFYLTCVNETTAMNYTKMEEEEDGHGEGQDHGDETTTPPVAVASSSTLASWSSTGVATLLLLLLPPLLLVGTVHGL